LSKAVSTVRSLPLIALTFRSEWHESGTKRPSKRFAKSEAQRSKMNLVRESADWPYLIVARRLGGLKEPVIAPLQAIRIGPGFTPTWYGDGRAVHLLKSVEQHRPIDLIQ